METWLSKELLKHFQFPEIKPDSLIELLGSERFVVSERAVELIGGDDYQDEQGKKFVSGFFAIRKLFAGDIIEC